MLCCHACMHAFVTTDGRGISRAMDGRTGGLDSDLSPATQQLWEMLSLYERRIPAPVPVRRRQLINIDEAREQEQKKRFVLLFHVPSIFRASRGTRLWHAASGTPPWPGAARPLPVHAPCST